jgi:hypothetical protein
MKHATAPSALVDVLAIAAQIAEMQHVTPGEALRRAIAQYREVRSEMPMTVYLPKRVLPGLAGGNCGGRKS